MDTTPMKAVVYTKYGPPDVVHIADIEKPVPEDNEVLVKIRASSVNPMDWHFMRGAPCIVRIDGGLRKPKVTRKGKSQFLFDTDIRSTAFLTNTPTSHNVGTCKAPPASPSTR